MGIANFLCFLLDQIVTLNGTCNMTSGIVFIEKRYRYEDICIGWDFAGLLYLQDSSRPDGEKEVMVDLSLIHDILPQSGGGCEPLVGADIGSTRRDRQRSILTPV